MSSHLSWPRHLVVVLVLAVATSGLEACTPWPGAATGGFAERYRTDWAPLRIVDGRYNSALQAGANRYAAGRMVDVRLLLTRAQREHEGGLLADSDVTLAKADRAMSAIERDVNIRRTVSRRDPRNGA